MDDTNWVKLNPKNTILFLGSGFSMDAINKENKNYLDGGKLAKRLQEILGDEESDTPSLRDISDDFIPDHQEALNKTLQPLMTTIEISADQAEIIKQPWRRVYTTNYDDVFEFGSLKAGLTPHPVSFDSPVTRIKKGVQVIHLHGNIHECTNENIDEKLVLSERSYVRQLAQTRPWFDEFTDDARFSDHIVFLGYSLSDTPINALLLSSSGIQEKTSFVVRGEPTGRYKRKLSNYGRIRPIALTGFAEHLRIRSIEMKKTPTPTRFLAFNEMNAKKDRKTLTQATSVEVRNLLTFGRFNILSCAASWPNATYLVPRSKLVSEAIDSLRTARTALIHSRSSNGKSLFSEMLSIALSQKGWRCIRSKSLPNLSDDDLKLLKSTHRLILFFKTHDDAIHVMKQLGTPRSEMRFVVEVSSSIADVRANALGKQLMSPIARINVNTFDQKDRDDFELILKKAGIRPNSFPEIFGKCIELRDFLLRLYEHEPIKKRIIEHAHPLWELPSVRRAMTTVFALKALELDVSPTFKREILGEDPAALLEAVPIELRSHVFDFLDFQDSSVEPYSTVVSEFLLTEFLVSRDILDWALNVATVAARRKQEQLLHDQRGPRFHEAVKVLGRIFQVSRLRGLLSEEPNKNEMIVAMFEKARHVPEINAEPLFWLQFAIASDEEYATLELHQHALEYLRTAYSRANDVENFKTYQLDTHHLRLLLRIETHENTERGTLQHWEDICDLLDRFNEMLDNENHRGFALRVLELLEKLVFERIGDMDESKKREMGAQLNRIVERLTLLDNQTAEGYLVDSVRHSVLRAANHIKDFKEID